jgi:helicase required for RNAi-mediated heterochromatin assembly 1
MKAERLRQGGLVAISTAKERFRNGCTVAVVAATRLSGETVSGTSGQNDAPSRVFLYLGKDALPVMSPERELLILEPTLGFYESVCHVMTGLQHFSESRCVSETLHQPELFFYPFSIYH